MFYIEQYLSRAVLCMRTHSAASVTEPGLDAGVRFFSQKYFFKMMTFQDGVLRESFGLDDLHAFTSKCTYHSHCNINT